MKQFCNLILSSTTTNTPLRRKLTEVHNRVAGFSDYRGPLNPGAAGKKRNRKHINVNDFKFLYIDEYIKIEVTGGLIPQNLSYD